MLIFKQVGSQTGPGLENVFRVVYRDTGGTEVRYAQLLIQLARSEVTGTKITGGCCFSEMLTKKKANANTQNYLETYSQNFTSGLLSSTL